MNAVDTPAASQFEHDAFVAFCERDKDLVTGEVLRHLKAAQLRFVTPADGKIGATVLSNVAKAIEHSRHTLAVITRNYLADDLCRLIDDVVMTLDPSAAQQRFIPMLFESLDDAREDGGSELPLLIRRITPAKFVDPDERNATMTQLLVQLCGTRTALNASNAKSAQRGVESLRYFVDTPEVQDKIRAFWDQFEEACGKIELLTQAKRLHDDFQRAQDAFRILLDRKRELILELAKTDADAGSTDLRWERLENASNVLQAELATAKSNAREYAGSGKPPAWVTMLDVAETALNQGLKDLGIELVKQGAVALTTVIQKEPTKLNKSLVEQARQLPLDRLISRQREILQHLEALDFNEEAKGFIEEFATGVQALELMHQNLQRLLWNHDSLQSIDDQLQPLDESDSPDLPRVRMAWLLVKEPIRELKKAKWMLDLKLEEAMSALELALNEYDKAPAAPGSARGLRRCYGKFRPIIAKGFQRTDDDLKSLCEEINRFRINVNQSLEQMRCPSS